MNILETTKQDGSARQYTHITIGGVYTIVTMVIAAGDIRDGGFDPIVVYKNEYGFLYARSLEDFKDVMYPID